MSDHLSADFINEQRDRLETLRAQILGEETGAGQSEIPRNSHARDARDSGEKGEYEAQRSRDEAVDANARLQLGNIRRALEKIEGGSYGLSDESGEPIQKGRLEAVPEANLTVEEEEERERRNVIEGRPAVS